MYDSGMQGTYTEPALISAMEKLAVRAQNKLVNVVSFLGMSQDRRFCSQTLWSGGCL